MSIGIWQVVLILLIVLILFGGGKLPKVMEDVARGVKNFRAGIREVDDKDEKVLIGDTGEPKITDSGLKRDEAAKSGSRRRKAAM